MMTFNDLYLREPDLFPIRRELYHSTGSGFFVFKKFLTDEQTSHMRSFWSSLDPRDWHQPYKGMDRIFPGCPNYYFYEEGQGQLSYFNFLWNYPPDELTYSVAFNIQLLRNRIESRNIYREIFPLANRSASYRMVLSRNIKKIVAPHRDWVGVDFDPRRLQVTLCLAEKGKDYDGIGFGMETNSGKKVVFGDDVEIHPGDLVLWRYVNLHFAEEVTSVGDIGFMRMIMPPEALGEDVSLNNRIKDKIKNIPFVESRALPIYRKIRRLINGR